MLASGAVVGASALAPATAAARRGGVFRAARLRTAQVEQALGIESADPMLSWRVEGDGVLQSAYRIRVATSLGALAAGRADLWDSGVVRSASPVVAYRGKPLQSRQRCFWNVTLWDQHGAQSALSDTGRWEMGLLGPDDWRGRWIAAENAQERAMREQGGVWVSAAPGERRFLRLPFESAAGDARLILQSKGALSNVTIDGEPLALPAYSPLAFGGAPPALLQLRLAPGRHMLGLEISGGAGAVAAQLQLPGGAWVTSGWQTAHDPTDGWRLPGAVESGWGKAAPLDLQPVFTLPPGPARMLRRSFRLDGGARRSARLYVAALGGYEIWLNGARVSEDVLQSEPSDYAHHIPYRVHDVGAMLQTGENVIAVMVADGFYASYAAPTGRYSYGPPPRRIRLQLETVGADGRPVVIATDESWRGADAGLRASEIYRGEDWDYRLEQAGWNAPGFDDSGWESATIAPTPPGAVIARIVPPIRVIRTLDPVAIREAAPGRHVIDMGQNFAGRVRLFVKGAPGDKVIVRHAEILDAQGELDRRNLRAARAEDTYILRGDPGGETLEPRFTYQGFRYVEVTGPHGLKADAVTGLVLSSSLEETGLFRIGQPMVEKLWTNTLWSQRSNFVGLPTDCPQRDERMGWTGDAQVFWDTAAFNMDVGEFTRTFMIAMRDAQSPQGAFPIWAPNADPSAFGPAQPTPGWSDAGVMLPYIAYQHYGDRHLIDEHWDAMERYVQGILADNPDGLWAKKRGPDFSDWLALDAKYPGDETTPKTLVATAMLARSVAQLAQLAAWTGRTEAARRWEARRASIGAIFARTFVAADGSVGNGSHAGYILALAIDLVPMALRERAAARLVADIRRRGTLLSTGFLGTPLALDALADTGHVGLAYELLLRTDFPSWGYMVRKGATTIWERWNGDSGDVAMNSFNHYSLGAVCGFLYRRVAGLTPLEPGFARVRIAPLPDARIGHAGCRYDSVRGRFEVDWRLSGRRLALDITVPPNATAEVRLPAAPGARIAEGGRGIARRTDLRLIARDDAAALIEIGPGRFAFEADQAG
jgi:alpha-L-rhamnosidase